MRRLLLAALSIAAASSCQLERFFPEDVGAGVARLTIRNTALIVSAVNNDAVCGFKSPQVMQSATQSGELGTVGVLTQTVTDCEIDMGELHQVEADCNGVGKLMGGRAKVSAVRTIEGWLTGDPDSPILPTHANAVKIVVDVEFDHWTTRLTNRNTQLTNLDGKESFTAYVHLATNATNGLNTLPDANITLEDITYEGARVIVDSGENEPFPVEVPSSSYRAQIGKWGEDENTFGGIITVWDKDVALPVKGDSILDPDYVAADYEKSWTCVPDLKQPISYEPEPLKPKLVAAGSRLAVKMSGAILQALNTDPDCGFNSASVKAAYTSTGDIGKAGGAVTYTVHDCPLNFPEKTEVARDCLGDVTILQGGAVVSGTMTVRGILTGDPEEPVVPNSREPAEITLDAQLQGLKVTDGEEKRGLQVLAGRLTAVIAPRMAKDEITGACSIATPVIRFESVHLDHALSLVMSGKSSFRLSFDTADMEAQNGNRDGVENHLTGSLVVDGEPMSMPLPGEEPILNPDYDPTSFDAAYACTPHMVRIESDDDCRFTDVLGNGAARLVVQTAGTLASLINKNDDCGFEDMFGVLIQPTEVVGDVGDMGSMSWEVEDCEVGSSDLSVASEDCTGGVTYFQGGALVDSSRTVAGERDTQFYLFDSVVPRARDAVTVWLNNVDLNEFVVYLDPAGPEEPMGKLTIHAGTLTATVLPATGERADEAGVFDVPTPVAKLQNIHLKGALATLESDGKRFELNIGDTNLSAANGPYHTETNVISGTITVNGDIITVPTSPLNPTYAQSSFDAAYTCTENLAGAVPVGW